MCPQQGMKAKNSDDHEQSQDLGVLALDPKVTYDTHLHYAIAHMSSTVGALPQHEATGRMELNFLAGKKEPRCDL